MVQPTGFSQYVRSVFNLHKRLNRKINWMTYQFVIQPIELASAILVHMSGSMISDIKIYTRLGAFLFIFYFLPKRIYREPIFLWSKLTLLCYGYGLKLSKLSSSNERYLRARRITLWFLVFGFQFSFSFFDLITVKNQYKNWKPKTITLPCEPQVCKYLHM